MVRGDGSDRTFLLNAGVVFLYPCQHCGDPAATVPYPECLRPPRAQHSVQGLLQGGCPWGRGISRILPGPLLGSLFSSSPLVSPLSQALTSILALSGPWCNAGKQKGRGDWVPRLGREV